MIHQVSLLSIARNSLFITIAIPCCHLGFCLWKRHLPIPLELFNTRLGRWVAVGVSSIDSAPLIVEVDDERPNDWVSGAR